jgi:hypothetical protein
VPIQRAKRKTSCRRLIDDLYSASGRSEKYQIKY